MHWSKITPSQLDESVPVFEIQIPRTLTSRADCEGEYLKLWQLFVSDVLPIADSVPWRAIGAAFRLEDGNSSIFFESMDGRFIDALPSVRIANEFMEDEVSQWTAREYNAEMTAEDVQSAWEEATRDFANIVVRSAIAAGIGSAVDLAHQPLAIRVYCYDEVVLEQCV